jgi:hypothetical protein
MKNIPSFKPTLLARRGFLSPLILLALAATNPDSVLAQLPPDLTGGQFTTNCGNATAAPIFDAALIGGGVYGVNNLIAVSDPDIVLIGNQWWMIFATGPSGTRAIQPFAAYLPPGASLSTTTTYPADPNGWHLVGAQANGQGTAIPVSANPGTGGWDQLAAETPSIDVGPDGNVSIYYSGHNAGQTPFRIGLMLDFNNGTAYGDPNPVMTAVEPWESSSGLPAILEQSVRWMPQLNKYIMYYTAGAWWSLDNTIAYAESTDGINWVNRQNLGFPGAYYNQDFLYNPNRRRYEMVISKDPTGAGGANPRNLVWRDAATPATISAGWQNEVTLLQYDAPNGAAWYNSGILSPAVKYGNLPGEQNRMYVFFHSYTQSGDMVIGRFYCDASQTFTLTPSSTAVSLAQGAGTAMNIGVTQQNGFTGGVNFSVSGFPAGVNNVFLPASSTTGTTLVMYVQPNVVPGQYPITVTGTSGGLTESSTFTLTVTGTSPALKPQAINFNTIPPQTIGTTLDLNASASSGLPVTFKVVPNGNCLLTGNAVAFVNTGACGIIANQAGSNGAYTGAPAIGQVVTVNSQPSSQTITFNAIPPQKVGTSLVLSATASSALPITYVVVPNGNCSVSGNTVTFLNQGVCGVVATQNGDGSYTPAVAVGQGIWVN